MDIPSTSFEAWEAAHRIELMAQFREYVRDALDDDGFDLTWLEDYWTWAREEYDRSS